MFYVEHWTGPLAQNDLIDINLLNKTTLHQVGEMDWEAFVRFLHNPYIVFIVARIEKTGRIVGKQTMYLQLLDDGETKGVIEQVATHPAHRRQGIARAIWNKILEIAREKQVDFIDLTSSDRKKEAHQLYLSLGFKKRKTNNFRLTLT